MPNATALLPVQAPTLDSYRDGVQSVVWCDHEKRWHFHGYSERKRHLIAHCTCPHSPYKRTGYTLRHAGEFTPAVRRSKGRRRPTHWPCAGCK